jgi:hypothetical protein
MTPEAQTAEWSFNPMVSPKDGYLAFVLLPTGDGTLAPGDGVAFTLAGVQVAGVAGPAVLDFTVVTSVGKWSQAVVIQLTTPSATPTITHYSVTPADPQTLTTLQGQPVVLSWTTSGASHCSIDDGQRPPLLNQPTSGVLLDKPQQGSAKVHETDELGRYYSREYTLFAQASGSAQPDERTNSTNVRLPTVLSFTASPATAVPGQPTNIAWSLANIDPNAGKVALTIAPGDGTAPQTIAIPPTALKWKGTVQPASLVPTAYSLALDNGYGATTSGQQNVGSPFPAGWNEQKGLRTLTLVPRRSDFDLLNRRSH